MPSAGKRKSVGASVPTKSTAPAASKQQGTQPQPPQKKRKTDKKKEIEPKPTEEEEQEEEEKDDDVEEEEDAPADEPVDDMEALGQTPNSTAQRQHRERCDVAMRTRPENNATRQQVCMPLQC